MVGPAILILTPRKVSGATGQEVETLVSSFSGEVRGTGKDRDFHICGRPFIMWFGSEITDDALEPDLPSDMAIGFGPQGQIGVAAMCNQNVDHILLATLASRLAAILDGVVWLDGQLHLDAATSGAAGLTKIGPFSHVVTADFLHRWIGSSSFRLPK